VTIAEPDPLVAVGAEPQIGAERRDPHGEHHHAARLRPGLQPAHRAGTETANLPADHDDVEPVDHRPQYVDPRRVAGHHHQPLQRHPHVGCGADAQLGKPCHTDPGTLA
jgi:hypothetical protein